MLMTEEQPKISFTQRALEHLGKRFFLESKSKGPGVSAFQGSFLGRLIDIEKSFNMTQDAIHFKIRAKAGRWTGTANLAQDWQEEQEETVIELRMLTSFRCITAKIPVIGGKTPVSFDVNTFLLMGQNEDENSYRWEFLE